MVALPVVGVELAGVVVLVERIDVVVDTLACSDGWEDAGEHSVDGGEQVSDEPVVPSADSEPLASSGVSVDDSDPPTLASANDGLSTSAAGGDIVMMAPAVASPITVIKPRNLVAMLRNMLLLGWVIWLSAPNLLRVDARHCPALGTDRLSRMAKESLE